MAMNTFQAAANNDHGSRASRTHHKLSLSDIGRLIGPARRICRVGGVNSDARSNRSTGQRHTVTNIAAVRPRACVGGHPFDPESRKICSTSIPAPLPAPQALRGHVAIFSRIAEPRLGIRFLSRKSSRAASYSTDSIRGIAFGICLRREPSRKIVSRAPRLNLLFPTASGSRNPTAACQNSPLPVTAGAKKIDAISPADSIIWSRSPRSLICVTALYLRLR